MARTIAEAQEEYTAVRDAYLKALKAESYGISGRSLSRPRAADLKKQMNELAREIERLEHGGIKIVAVTPV